MPGYVLVNHQHVEQMKAVMEKERQANRNLQNYESVNADATTKLGSPRDVTPAEVALTVTSAVDRWAERP